MPRRPVPTVSLGHTFMAMCSGLQPQGSRCVLALDLVAVGQAKTAADEAALG